MIDTREMLADGLTNGGLGRTPLVAAMENGRYITQHEWKAIRFDFKRAREIASVKAVDGLVVVGFLFEETI